MNKQLNLKNTNVTVSYPLKPKKIRKKQKKIYWLFQKICSSSQKNFSVNLSYIEMINILNHKIFSGVFNYKASSENILELKKKKFR